MCKKNAPPLTFQHFKSLTSDCKTKQTTARVESFTGFDSRACGRLVARGQNRLTAPSPFVCFADISPTPWGNLPPDCHSLPRRFESLTSDCKTKQTTARVESFFRDSTLALRCSVRRGSDSPPDCHSLPRRFESLTSDCKTKQTTARVVCFVWRRVRDSNPR